MHTILIMNHFFTQKDSFTLAPPRVKFPPTRMLRWTSRRTRLSSPSSHPSFFQTSGTTSFTLVELLIVIGILAILTAAVVIVLNPAELLKQGRDSTRMTDLASLSSAIRNLQTQSESALSSSTAQTLYISVPDTSGTCANLGLPSLPSGYSYHCVPTASSTRVDGTGWLPVNLTASSIQSLSRLPLDPTNTTSSGLYYAYIANPTTQTFSVYVSNLESAKYQSTPSTDGGVSSIAFEKGTNPSLMPPIFPYGEWIKVPGNSIFSTSDFYVMKYEAKCDYDNNGIGDTSQTTGYNTWPNNTYPCTGSGHNMVSTAQGYPLANISQTTSATYCTNIGAHLITNNEWQTIAWNIQQQAANWSGGTIGSGYLSRGNSNSSAAQEATSEYGTGYSDFTHKRTHIFSNNQTIWDLAGNVYEWTSDTILGTNKPVGVAGFWVELTAVSSYGTLTRNQFGPYNATHNSSQGMGQYYQGNYDGTTYAFIRGATWSNGTNAGVEALALSNTPGNTITYLGVRCAR